MEVTLSTFPHSNSVKEVSVSEEIPDDQKVRINIMENGVAISRYVDGFCAKPRYLTWHDLAELAVEP